MGRVSRKTKQKELIWSEVEKIRNLFTAEELYGKVHSKGMPIGIATIYRFLKELKETSQIHSYICEGKTVYSTSRKDHCHFVCQKCGNVSHFNVQSLDFLKKKVSGNMTQFQISVEGFCKDCANKAQ